MHLSALRVLFLVGLLASVPRATAQAFSPLFSTSTLEDGYAVAQGDLDGDGTPDVVTGAYGVVRVHLNTGQGTLQPGQVIQEADKHATYGLALGDLDGDGDLDLVTADNYDRANRVFRNDGHGRFELSQRTVEHEASTSVALGDLDGDGDLDGVFGNIGHNAVYLNDGRGRMTLKEHLPEQGVTYAVALGDIDRDGDLDLVAGNNGLNRGEANRVYVNDGHGHLSLHQCSEETDITYAVALADLDGDGHLDYVAGNYGVSRIYRNDGRGHFILWQTFEEMDRTCAVAAGDVDRDGDLDLVFGNNYTLNAVHWNLGNGRFGSADRFGVFRDKTYGIALADMNADAWLDCVAVNHQGPVRVLVPRIPEQESILQGDSHARPCQTVHSHPLCGAARKPAEPGL